MASSLLVVITAGSRGKGCWKITGRSDRDKPRWLIVNACHGPLPSRCTECSIGGVFNINTDCELLRVDHAVPLPYTDQDQQHE